MTVEPKKLVKPEEPFALLEKALKVKLTEVKSVETVQQ